MQGFGRVLFLLALAQGLLCPGQVAAVSVEVLDIAHEDDSYTVMFDVLLAADAAKARTLLTDYRQWPRLSETIVQTRLIETLPDGRQRVSVDFRSCVLVMFCTRVQQVKDMETGANRTSYRTDMVPGQGDFAYGWEVWQIVPERGNATRVRYHARLVPGFPLPPFVGPWMLKRELRRELLGTATSLERLAATR